MDIEINEVQEIIKNLESSGELSIKEEKYLKVAKLCLQLAAENARYSMSAGHADQRMAESRAVRSALGFKPDADDVSPSELVEAINQIVAELCVIRTAHPQPLGPAMDAAIDAFNAEEMPETGMLNSYFILRESIRIKTPATDRIVAGIKADGVEEMASVCRGYANEEGCSVNMKCSYNLTAERAESYAAYIRRQLRDGAEK